MEKLDIILLVISSGFVVVFCFFKLTLNKVKISGVESKKDIHDLSEKVTDVVTDVDRLLHKIEGALSAKKCCMLKEEKKSKRSKQV